MANLNDKFQKVAHIRLDVDSMIATASTKEEKQAAYDKIAWHIGLLKSTTHQEGKYLADGVTKAEFLQELSDTLLKDNAPVEPKPEPKPEPEPEPPVSNPDESDNSGKDEAEEDEEGGQGPNANTPIEQTNAITLDASGDIENYSFSNIDACPINISGCDTNGTINIKNCKFILKDGTAAIRISNETLTDNFTVNIENCDYAYKSAKHAKNASSKLGFIFFEDTNTDGVMEKPFTGITINIKNVTRNGQPCTENIIGTNDETQFSCMSYDHTIGDRKAGMITDESHYPTFVFA